MSTSPQYFLGANTPGGFYSLYDEMLPENTRRAVFILKGGPGCGKSTLMRAVERSVKEEHVRTEEILCSGDPDSLDAILLPDQGIAVVDGTSPHAMEAACPGAVDRYVNLGSCYDSRALYPIRDKIRSCKADCTASYRHAYQCLAACAALDEEIHTLLFTPELSDKMARRSRGILTRELPARSGTGSITKRFLSTPSHKGLLTLTDTALSQCGRIYELTDRFHTAHGLLEPLLAGAVKRGYDVVACPDPMHPERLAHLLIPEAGLAFLSVPAGSGKPYRRLHLDAMADRELLRRHRTRIRFTRRISASLMEEALGAFREAKANHDRLENLYHPYVDFDRAEGKTKAVIAEILSLLA